MLMSEARQAVVEGCQRLAAEGLVRGTAGNVSIIDRAAGLIAISPSGVAYDALDAASVAVTTLDGNQVDGAFKPSSELVMHRLAYEARPEITAVVHTHSPFATTFAVLRRPIEPVHYVIGFAAKQVRVAPYERFGSADLGRESVQALGADNAILLANHGVLAVGADLESALGASMMVEYVAELYWRALQIGQPVILDEQQMDEVITRFDTYHSEPSGLAAGEGKDDQ